MKRCLAYSLYIICIALFFTTQSNSQITWKQSYVGGANYGLTEMSPNKYFTGIHNSSYIDSLGKYLDNILPDTNLYLSVGLISIQSNRGVMAGFYPGYCNNTRKGSAYIAILDTNWQIVRQVSIAVDSNCGGYCGSIIQGLGNIIVSGRGVALSGTEFDSTTFFAVFDTSLTMLQLTRIGTAWGEMQFCRQMPDSSFIGGFNYVTNGACLARFDKHGTIIWSKSYFRPKGFIHDALPESDGSVIVTGYTDSIMVPYGTPYPTGFFPKLFVMKVDTSGTVLWCKGFDSDKHWMMERSQIIKNKNGHYVILANVGTDVNVKPMLLSLDTNGNIDWYRIHGNSGDYNLICNIIECTSGGYMVSGTSIGHFPGYSSPIAYGYLYRLDSLGHGPCNEFQRNIYTSYLFPVDSNIVLTTTGSGYTYASNFSFIHQTSLTWYNDCTQTSLPESPYSYLSSATVHPNPAKTSIYLQTAPDLSSGCYYELYNTGGKLLLRRKLIPGATETEINVQEYPKGLYLLRLTDGEEEVTKKVVVE